MDRPTGKSLPSLITKDDDVDGYEVAVDVVAGVEAKARRGTGRGSSARGSREESRVPSQQLRPRGRPLDFRGGTTLAAGVGVGAR